MQPVEGVGVLGRAGLPRGIRGLREMVEPGMKVVERFAVAALAVLDALHQAPQQGFDGALVHRLVLGGGIASVSGVAGLPTCF